MVDAIEFPRALLREQAGQWSIAASTIFSGQSGTGAFGRVRMDGGGVWTSDYEQISLRTKEHVKLWRAIETLADNGVMPLVVPMCDRRHMPAPIVNGSPIYSYGSIPHSDGSFFSDGSGYSQAVVAATVTSIAALRATTLSFSMVYGSAIEGGEHFSITHPTQGRRLYRIGSVSEAAGVTTITFRPPLREAIAIGDELDFEEPSCVMQLAKPDSMNLTLQMRKYGNPSVSFVEYFFPPSA